MTRQETGVIMDILSAAYPKFYAGREAPDPRAVVNLWAEMFAEDPVQLVAAAVKALIATDGRGFPPHIGAVKAKLRQITQPEQMTELEAWRLVRRAIHGASMEPWSRRITAGGGDGRNSAQRNFDALPALLQRLVGGPEQLAAWERVPEDEIDTVLQSNFMRSYRERARQQREFDALPESVKAIAATAAESLALHGGAGAAPAPQVGRGRAGTGRNAQT